MNSIEIAAQLHRLLQDALKNPDRLEKKTVGGGNEYWIKCSIADLISMVGTYIHQYEEPLSKYFRVKPEPQWVPFTFETAPETCKVKQKDTGEIGVAFFRAKAFSVYGTSFNNFNNTFQWMFDHYTKLDGTPFGIQSES